MIVTFPICRMLLAILFQGLSLCTNSFLRHSRRHQEQFFESPNSYIKHSNWWKNYFCSKFWCLYCSGGRGSRRAGGLAVWLQRPLCESSQQQQEEDSTGPREGDQRAGKRAPETGAHLHQVRLIVNVLIHYQIKTIFLYQLNKNDRNSNLVLLLGGPYLKQIAL